MIDQRVSEGILSNFFNIKALTTTIPAQLVKNTISYCASLHREN